MNTTQGQLTSKEFTLSKPTRLGIIKSNIKKIERRIPTHSCHKKEASASFIEETKSVREKTLFLKCGSETETICSTIACLN